MNRLLNKLFFRIKKRILEQNIIDSRAIINPTAYISGTIIDGEVTVDEGCKIFQSHLHGNVSVDKYTSIWGPGTSIISHINSITIGRFCSIARYVSIQESNHKIKRLSSYHFSSNIFNGNITADLTSKGSVHIGHDVWIGAQAIILSGVTIGNGAVIGAGSVVTSDIPAYAIVGGNPAKVIHYRFPPEVIQQVEQLKWWDWDIEKIHKNRKFFELDIENGLPDII